MPLRRLSPALLGFGLCGVVAAQSISPLKPEAAFKGHTDPIYAVAICPDGRTAATGSFDKSIKLWDLSTGKELRTLAGANGHQSLVLGIAFSPAGDMLASGGADNFARIWDVPSGKAGRELPLGAGVAKVAVSPDGKAFAAGGADGRIRTWSAADGKQLFEMTGHAGPVTGLAYANNGQTLVSIGADRTLRYWNAAAGQPVAALGVGPTAADGLAVHPGNAAVYTAGPDGVLRFWPTQPPAAKKLLDHAAAVTAVAVSPDGNAALTGGADKAVRWVNLANGQPIFQLAGATAAVESVSVMPNGTAFAAGTADGKLFLWGNDGKLKAESIAHSGPVRAVSFHPSQPLLATAGDDGLLRVWQLPAALPKALAHPDRVLAAVLLPDGKRLLTGSADKVVRIWNNGAVERQFPGHEAPVTALAATTAAIYSADADGAIRAWDLASGQPTGAVSGHEKPVSRIAVGADGKHLASADESGTVKVWQLPLAAPKPPAKLAAVPTYAAGGPVLGLEPVAGQGTFRVVAAGGGEAILDPMVGTVSPVTGSLTAFTRSPDGTRAVAAMSGTSPALVVRGPDNKILREISLPAPAESVALSANGTRIAVVTAAGKDRTVRVFDANSGRELQTITTTPAAVHALGFFPDNRTVFVAEDKSVGFTEAAVTAAVPAHAGGVKAALFLPSGQFATAGADKNLKVWDLAQMKEVRSLPLPAPPKALAVSRDGAVLAAAAGRAVKLWQTADGKELPFPAPPFEPTALAFSPDRTKLVLGSADKAAWVYDVATGDVVQFFPQGGAVTAIAALPAQPAFVVGGDDKTIAVQTIAVTRVVKDPAIRGPLTTLPSATHLITGSAVWNLGSVTKERTLEATAPVSAVALSKNSQLVAVAGGSEPTIGLYTFADGKPVGTIRAPAKVTDLAWHPNGQMLAGVLADKSVTAWNVAFTPGQPLPGEFGSALQTFAHPAAPSSLAFLGDTVPQLVSGCSDGAIRVWRLASDLPAKSLQHPNLVDGVAFDRTGTLLATACHDGIVRVWDVAKGQVAKAINAHTQPQPSPVYAVAWTPDAKFLLSASYDKSIKVWDPTAGTLVREIKPGSDRPPLPAAVAPTAPALVGPVAGSVLNSPPHPGHHDQVFALAITKDGKFVASGSSDRTVKLWEIATGNLVREFPNPALKPAAAGQPQPSHPGFVHALRFSNDGKELISVGTAPRNQGYLAVWTVADGKLVWSGEQLFGAIYAVDILPNGTEALLGCGPKLRGQSDSEAVLVRLPGK
jgi:WD40 repeat protein